jgi:hypothetical protein
MLLCVAASLTLDSDRYHNGCGDRGLLAKPFTPEALGNLMQTASIPSKAMVTRTSIMPKAVSGARFTKIDGDFA